MGGIFIGIRKTEIVKSIENIDFKALKEQKRILIDMIMDWGKADDEGQRNDAQEVEGVVYLLDAIQDEVVELGLRTEKEVFG